jgi:hypothetical protein
MGKAPAFQFYVRDWLADPDLQMASSSTKGIWINALCFMWESQDRGRITGEKIAMARMLMCSNDEFEHFLEEADRLHFCDVERQENVRGDKILTLTNRRMFREEKSKKLHRDRQVRYEEKKQSKSNDAKIDGEMTPPSSSSTSTSNIYSLAQFELFWKAYPKKRSRGQAEKAFQKISPDEELLNRILTAIEQAKKSEAWLKEEGRFIPYPATWLNARGWEDEYADQSLPGEKPPPLKVVNRDGSVEEMDWS